MRSVLSTLWGQAGKSRDNMVSEKTRKEDLETHIAEELGNPAEYTVLTEVFEIC